MNINFTLLHGWIGGRQLGGYKVLPLLGLKINNRYVFDVLMLRYAKGNKIAPHTDREVLLRINIELVKPRLGGIFKLHGKHTLKLGRLTIFRPTLKHEVSEIKLGNRLVFSIGIGNLRIYNERAKQ